LLNTPSTLSIHADMMVEDQEACVMLLSQSAEINIDHM
jgi:hypothetical protein